MSRWKKMQIAPPTLFFILFSAPLTLVAKTCTALRLAAICTGKLVPGSSAQVPSPPASTWATHHHFPCQNKSLFATFCPFLAYLSLRGRVDGPESATWALTTLLQFEKRGNYFDSLIIWANTHQFYRRTQFCFADNFIAMVETHSFGVNPIICHAWNHDRSRKFWIGSRKPYFVWKKTLCFQFDWAVCTYQT